jgi:hypothetical protein
MEAVVACSRYCLGIGIEELKISGVATYIRRSSLRDMSV